MFFSILLFVFIFTFYWWQKGGEDIVFIKIKLGEPASHLLVFNFMCDYYECFYVFKMNLINLNKTQGEFTNLGP